MLSMINFVKRYLCSSDFDSILLLLEELLLHNGSSNTQTA